MSAGGSPLPRRVLLVTQYFWPEPGAPSVRYAAITRTLRSLGIDVDVLTAVPSYPTGVVREGYSAWRPVVERHDGMRIQRLPTLPYGGRNRWLRMLNHASLAVSALAGVAVTARPDLVLVESPPLPLVPTAAFIARRHGVPLVMYAADLWPDVAVAMGALHAGRLERALRALESLSYRLSWRITVPTTGLVERLERHPDARGKVLLLPNGVDPTVFRPLARSEAPEVAAALGGLSDRILFMFAGTVGPAQALDVVLDAAAVLRDAHDIGFVVIGDGPERERLARRAAELGLRNVLFTGSVQPDGVARYLAYARATLVMLRDLPIFEDARPAKVLPSLACGRPVIFCGRGEMAPLIERNECGLVVPPEDPAALARAVRRLADDEPLAVAMGQRGRRFALAEFDFGDLVRRWIGEVSAGMLGPWHGKLAQ